MAGAFWAALLSVARHAAATGVGLCEALCVMPLAGEAHSVVRLLRSTRPRRRALQARPLSSPPPSPHSRNYLRASPAVRVAVLRRARTETITSIARETPACARQTAFADDS